MSITPTCCGKEKPIVLHLAYHPPLAWHPLVNFLCSRSNLRVERLANDSYLRTVKIDDETGWIIARHDALHNQIVVEISPSLFSKSTQLQMRLRDLFDLDTLPDVIDTHLKRDHILRQRVLLNPGLRIPRCMDAFELSVRAILGQQVTVKAATTLYGRFVAIFGEPVQTPFPQLDRTGPVASAIANTRLQNLIDLGLTQRRAFTIQQLAQKMLEGKLILEKTNRLQAIEQLLELPGIGPWTAQYIAMRALGDPNAIPESDIGLMRALQLKKPKEVRHHAEKWQPWRAYGAMHLWHNLGTGG